LGDVQQDEPCVDEIECVLRKLIGDEIDLGNFAAAVRQVRQVSWVSVYREHATAGHGDAA
jgi:hypothetical protein